MSKILLMFLIACASPRAQQTATTPKPTPSVQPVEPKTRVVVWSTYADFTVHGFKGEGRLYARDGAGWSSIDCSISHIADPQAGPNADQRNCDARKPVPNDLWPILETIAPKPGYEENDVICDRAKDTCAALGVPNKPLTPP